MTPVRASGVSVSFTTEVVTAPPDLDEIRKLLMDSVSRDQGYGYVPAWHWDIDHLLEVYVDNPRNVMVAARTAGVTIGCCGIRVGTPPGPAGVLRALPPRAQVAQLVRLVVTPSWRRHGVGQTLVRACLDRVAEDPQYRAAYLHTNADVPGAREFGLSQGAKVLDGGASSGADDSRLSTVHMVLPLERRGR